MEPSKEAIAVRITRLNRLILGKVSATSNTFFRKNIDREALFDALTVLYEECNSDNTKKCDELVKCFVDKYRSTIADLRRTRVCLNDFDILQKIGKGQFGDVNIVREKETGDVYALKTLKKEQTLKCGRTSVEEERTILASHSGPWFPKLQYAFQDQNHLYLVMELCSGGDLAGLLSRRSHPLAEKDAAFYVAEVAHALKTLHTLGYVHRDVKPDNVLLDRCGHVKLADFGSCVRLSDDNINSMPVCTADYVAPELLAAADCTHTACIECCKGISSINLTACDYWSLGVIAFELVTLKKPFSKGDNDSVARILSNIQRYEKENNPVPPFEAQPNGPSNEWRTLVGGLLKVSPSKRYQYLDTVQHPALSHLSIISIRDQPPPWVPSVRGPEDSSFFSPQPKEKLQPNANLFRTRVPFAGQLPYIGFSYVALDEGEDSISNGFNATSHDCTAIDMATFKSAEKLAVVRAREVSALQTRLSESEAKAELSDAALRAERLEAERTRARLNAEITTLTLQNKRLERQIEIEKEERMSLERNNHEVTTSRERNNSELRKAQTVIAELEKDRCSLKQELQRIQSKLNQVENEKERALAAADEASQQQKHYKDSMAKERALRRQTMTEMCESREAALKLASANALAKSEAEGRARAEELSAKLTEEIHEIRVEKDELRNKMAHLEEQRNELQRSAKSANEELKKIKNMLTEEKVRSNTLAAQVQELQKTCEELCTRESALEELNERTQSRLQERLEAAEARAAHATNDHSRYREKVQSLEQLVRQLEREVNALEMRNEQSKKEIASDTESVGESETAIHGQVALLKEQLDKAEAQLLARAEEIATLKQEARTANLARWRKERELGELSTETKSTARDIKRLEDRLALAQEARKEAEAKLNKAETELKDIKPKYEKNCVELDTWKQRFEKLEKAFDVIEAEVVRSRNDILKLKSELQYSEKRRIRAEQQEELANRERAKLRDEAYELRQSETKIVQNNKALQEACSMLEDQLTDMERLADMHETKNKDLESEVSRLRKEVSTLSDKLLQSERLCSEYSSSATIASMQFEQAKEQSDTAVRQVKVLQERLEIREATILELESTLGSIELECQSRSESTGHMAQRLKAVMEEAAQGRTQLAQAQTQLQAMKVQLDEAQAEIAACREAADGAAAWWRMRETKADATLKQQTKLIDFLQAKLEEKRKKCSLGNKLFGNKSTRKMSNASPPWRKANKELRDEVDRLRAKLAAVNDNKEPSWPSTPMREKPKMVNGNKLSIDTPDGRIKTDDSYMDVVWSDCKRDRVQVSCANGLLLLNHLGRELRGKVVYADIPELKPGEAERAIRIRIENPIDGECDATVICNSVEQHSSWVPMLKSTGYVPYDLVRMARSVVSALFVDGHTVALGCSDGLHSLRGPICLQSDSGEDLPPSQVSQLASISRRVLLIYKDVALHGNIHALNSVSRRASELKPTITVGRIKLPETSAPHLIQTISTEHKEGPCVAIACGRRVFLLRYEASITDFKISRSITVDRAPTSLLLTNKALYITGEKPLKINLPSGALESFAMDEPTVMAASKKRTPPKAILLIKESPLEMLICYSECAIFVDEHGRKTRTEDPKWKKNFTDWKFIEPFLYAVDEHGITIFYINDEAYKSPPCTCDDHSVASTPSEYFVPETFTVNLEDPKIIGLSPNGVLVRSKQGDQSIVSIIDGMAALRSIGASVESLETISDNKGSSTDLMQSSTDVSQNSSPNESQESIVPNTPFAADIRKRAQQLRKNNRQQNREALMKEILMTDLTVKRHSTNHVTPTTSEFSSDSESEHSKEMKNPADLCAEMFTRQVRFQ